MKSISFLSGYIFLIIATLTGINSNSFLKTTKFEKVYNGTLLAEGPLYIPHKDM